MVSKLTLSLLTTLILGSSMTPVFAAVDFPIIVSQNRNKEQLDELLRRGRDYVDKGDYRRAI
ncbi:MAG: Tfp pilus assembly protein PilF, partial [Crocosphaera sp.]